MMVIIKDLVMVIVLLAVITGAVRGSMYARKVWDEGHASDTLLRSKQGLIDARQKSAAEIAADLQAARNVLAIEAAKLSDMRAGFSLSAYRGFVIEQQGSIEHALWSSDPFFNDPRSTAPTIGFKIDSAKAQHLAELRQEINQILVLWQANPGSIAPVDLALVNNYLDELSTVISGLTPENSGLTQEEIDNYEQIVAEAEQTVADAINSADSDIVTPEDIQGQETIVIQNQETVDELEEIIENTLPADSSDPGTTGTDPADSGDTGTEDGSGEVPPSQASDPITPTSSGAPTLIQGTNSF